MGSNPSSSAQRTRDSGRFARWWRVARGRREVLAGLSNADIARKRGTAVRTIANQIASIYRKLQVSSRLELSLYALAGRHTFESSAN